MLNREAVKATIERIWAEGLKGWVPLPDGSGVRIRLSRGQFQFALPEKDDIIEQTAQGEGTVPDSPRA